MSFVRAVPEFLGTSARTLAGLGSTINNSNAIAALPTVAVSAAAGDQVSAAVAAFFSGHARSYQSLSAQAAQIHDQFVQKLGAGADTYAAAEAANASPMQEPLAGTDALDKTTSVATTGSVAGGGLRGNGNARGSGAAHQGAVNGGAGGKLGAVSAGGNSSSGAGESSGNERFGGLLLGNGGGGTAGPAAKLRNTPATASGRFGGLLSAANRVDQHGGGVPLRTERPTAILLRLVDADGGRASTGAPAEVPPASSGGGIGGVSVTGSAGGSGGLLGAPGGSAFGAHLGSGGSGGLLSGAGGQGGGVATAGWTGRADAATGLGGFGGAGGAAGLRPTSGTDGSAGSFWGIRGNGGSGGQGTVAGLDGGFLGIECVKGRS